MALKITHCLMPVLVRTNSRIQLLVLITLHSSFETSCV